ncbi:MAG TPA: thioredoxin family protein [Anaerolineaceae bacterium]|nr:thioredoxin family protein [Anaerolineaceae bacterium]
MAIIPDNIKQQVQEAFRVLSGSVRIIMFTQGEGGALECSMCSETRQLVEEVAGLSDKIQFQVYDLVKDAQLAAQYKIEKIPAVAILQGGIDPKDYGIRLYGIPSGYEFSSLIEDIILASRGTSDLSLKTLKDLEKLENPIHIQVFVTPTCPYCPRAVILAHKLALASDKITADMVEATEFPHLANRYQVYGVPRTVINDVVHIEGAVPEAALVGGLMKVLDEEGMGKLRREWEMNLN